ncbi:hepatic leukemia factor-like isoform X1 [Varroa destructor]|uniref:BZIP domain-containing protein n=2 Tax=Varroa destructor TaxID=109461 RepID=A0A7M7MGF1_VARDE|nr:hepatic leukemia factor-like isoform X1 [Varroa destructor]
MNCSPAQSSGLTSRSGTGLYDDMSSGSSRQNTPTPSASTSTSGAAGGHGSLVIIGSAANNTHGGTPLSSHYQNSQTAGGGFRRIIEHPIHTSEPSDSGDEERRRGSAVTWTPVKSVITSRLVAERSRTTAISAVSSAGDELNLPLSSSDKRDTTSSSSVSNEFPSPISYMAILHQHTACSGSGGGSEHHNNQGTAMPHNEAIHLPQQHHANAISAASHNGHLTWERNLSDIKLEYMDLDDFLQEGGSRCIRQPQLAGGAHLQQQRQQQQLVAYGQQRQSNDDLGGTASHRSSLQRARCEQNMYSGYSNIQSLAEQFVKEVKPAPEGAASLVNVECTFTRNDLALATIPGQEDFDPSNHSFSEDELKPQPIIKKSRKQFVPPEHKDEKYWARRQKNNIAAKRSREVRRVKENQIVLRASFLEKENLALREEVRKLLQENEILLQRLHKYEN